MPLISQDLYQRPIKNNQKEISAGRLKKFFRLILPIGIFGYFFILGWIRLDPDFGWHLKAGQYFLAHGIPTHDVFTYTATNFPWIDHEWLMDVGIAKLWQFGGYGLVAAVFAALWTTGTLVASRRFSWPIILIAIVALAPYAGIRPVALTALLFTVLERLLAAKNQRTWWWIVPLFALWANLHAGFVLGLLVLWLWFLIKKPRLPVQIPLLASAITLINPYGLSIYIEVYRTLIDGSLRFRVVEWLPAYFQFPTQVYIVFFIACFWFIVKEKRTAIVSIPGLLFLAALSSTRHAPLFIVGSLRYFEDFGAQLRDRLPPSLAPAQRKVLIILSLMIIGIVGGAYYVTLRPPYNREAGFPRQQVAYLQQHPCPGNIYNTYTAGGYLIWKLPGQPVYIDGRMPSWKLGTTDYFADYLHIQTDATFRQQQFTTYNIRCVLAPTVTPIATGFEEKLQSWLLRREIHSIDFVTQLQQEGWTTVVTGDGLSLLLK